MSMVIAVHRNSLHAFSKQSVPAIELIAGHGVSGDAHAGVTVKHRSRVARDPNQPNLRQVHLLHSELFDELRDRGFQVVPGEMGENITTRGVDILGLSEGTLICIGADAIIRVTGLRNPCVQIDQFQRGLLRAMSDREPDGTIARKAGIMATVERGGWVRPGDPIEVRQPPIAVPLRVV